MNKFIVLMAALLLQLFVTSAQEDTVAVSTEQRMAQLEADNTDLNERLSKLEKSLRGQFLSEPSYREPIYVHAISRTLAEIEQELKMMDLIERRVGCVEKTSPSFKNPFVSVAWSSHTTPVDRREQLVGILGREIPSLREHKVDKNAIRYLEDNCLALQEWLDRNVLLPDSGVQEVVKEAKVALRGIPLPDDHTQSSNLKYLWKQMDEWAEQGSIDFSSVIRIAGFLKGYEETAVFAKRLETILDQHEEK